MIVDTCREENKIEIVVTNTWKEILDVENINNNESFFELNGNSLKAVIMIEMLKKKLGVELFIQDIYENETLEEFVEYIENKNCPNEYLVKGGVDANVCAYNKKLESRYIRELLEEYDKNAKKTVVKKYKMLKFQKYLITMGYTNYLSILSNQIIVKRCDDIDVVKNAIKELITEQAVLRTGISRDGKYMNEYDPAEWSIPVISEEKYKDNWDSILEELCYIRNEQESFSENKLLSKIFIIERITGEIEIRLFVHHCLWDRMSHIIFVNRFKSIINNLSDCKIELEEYSEYVEKTRPSIGEKIECSLSLAIKYLIPTLRYRNKTKKPRCFDVTVCFKPDSMLHENIKANPIQANIELFSKYIKELQDNVEKIPFIVITNGRVKENSKTLGMYLNTVVSIYDIEKNKITNVLNDDEDYGRSVSSKLFFEMNNSKLSKKFSTITPIINYVGLYPDYVDAKKDYFEIQEIDTSESFESRITSFISDDRFHMNFKLYADSAEDVERVVKRVLNI